MNIIKVKTWNNVPHDYTGIVEWESGTKIWFKNGKRHRENGPAWIYKNKIKSWYLDGNCIWNSDLKLDLTSQIILSKENHPNYLTVQVWKILDKNKFYDQFIIPGMEELIKE